MREKSVFFSLFKLNKIFYLKKLGESGIIINGKKYTQRRSNSSCCKVADTLIALEAKNKIKRRFKKLWQ
jgi:hypothetical protein